MERRDFIYSSGLLSALTLAPTSIFSYSNVKIDPVLLNPREKLDHKGSMDIRVWVRSSMTGGVFSNVECAVAPKTMGPAPHGHLELDELMYVVEGTAKVLVGDEVVTVEQGAWHLRPRQIKHTFWNASDNDLRFFDLYFNQPFEEYFEAIFHKLTKENGYDSKRRSEEISKLATNFGIIRYDDSSEQRNQIIEEYKLNK